MKRESLSGRARERIPCMTATARSWLPAKYLATATVTISASLLCAKPWLRWPSACVISLITT